MKIAGSYTFEAPGGRVWPLLFDPNALIHLIPGCQRLEQVSPGEYRGLVQVGVAAVAGTYQVSARLVEQEAPRYCRFEGEISGSAGSATGSAALRLKEVNGATLLDYEAQAVIAGALAAVSSRFVEGVAKTLIDQGLSRLNDQLRSEKPLAADAAGTAAG